MKPPRQGHEDFRSKIFSYIDVQFLWKQIDLDKPGKRFHLQEEITYHTVFRRRLSYSSS